MNDSCTIVDPVDGQPVYDPDTDDYEPVDSDPVYAGKCRIKPRGVAESLELVGDTQITTQDTVLHVPWSAVQVDVNQVVTVDGVSSYTDPTLLGTTYRITAVVRESESTKRILRLEEITG